ncbi:MAG: ATP-binding cassette domain-containing protein [candidate division Zixibacteria bacterium]|nr:ATP-binding cassette domain-containing protein [candidate division Zixibacteria bacterium]
MIQLDRLSVTYPGRTTPALHNVSLTLSAGESVCIMGANGSGKSTLALVLAGVLRPSSGQVLFTEDGPAGAGIVFQKPENQMVAALVEKELAFGLENQALLQAVMHAEIEKIAASFDLQSLLQSTTSRLSGGEQQRVALASVMITSPNLLMLDEPDSFLDAESRTLLDTALKGIRARQPELIEVRVTQDISVARACSRLILLDGGEVIANDSPEIILNQSDLLRKCRLIVEGASIDPAIPAEQELSELKTTTLQPDKLIVRDLAFEYGPGRPVLRDLSFSLNCGEVLGVAGPTGSGKTSLGLLLAGILEPQSGTIIWARGEEPMVGGPFATMALQQPERQFFLPTCAQEIAFGPANNGHALRASDIDSLLDLVGLPPAAFRDRDPLTLSVGEQRRLACAVVVALDKPFIIFDEPTAGLDSEGVARFVSLIRRIKPTHGLVVISHDHDLLTRISNRVLVCGQVPSPDRL